MSDSRVFRVSTALAGGLLRPAALALALAALPGVAFAMASNSNEPPKETKTTTQCTDGKVWDEATKSCVNPKQGFLNDDSLFEAAREFAYAGQYDNAIRLLTLAAKPDDPRILNYLGYANRMAGRVEVAMGYYRKALARDPDYILARSYFGQALLEQGDLEGAMRQLAEIRTRGGADTPAYQALLESIGTGSYR